MPKIAHLNREHGRDGASAERTDEKLTRIARATAKAGADAARESLQLAQGATEAAAHRVTDVAEDLGGTTRKLAEESPEFGRDFAELLGEQTRHNVDTLNAFARAVNWTEVAQAQSRLIAGSFLRFSQFSARYGEFLFRGMTATATLPRR
jgi:ABC-type transporter Mla subunit MlaD